MADEKKEKWLGHLSATTVVIAVLATLATFKGGGYGTKSILCQSKASDQWSYFQSKSIKQYLYEIQKENLVLELHKADNKVNTDEVQKLVDNYDQKIKKYTEEKEQISKEAKNFESIRDELKFHQDAFGFAVIFLQVAILLSSISAFLKNKIIWFTSIILGLIGAVYFFNGFFLFF